MIKFITTQETNNKPTFGDVAIDQFFIDRDGDLCQKHRDDTYNVIAKRGGHVHSMIADGISPDRQIIKILPHVTKIEF